ncbi:hypothetical protein Trydic_g11881 [Trypoxylus dichotomus]
MYNLGKIIRERYNEFLGEIYTPDILDAWASSMERCQASLQVFLASLFPPKDSLIWKEGYNWQPICYKYLPREEDDMFWGWMMDKFLQRYNEYCFNGDGRPSTEEVQTLLSYVQKHTNVTMKTPRDLLRLKVVLSGEEAYGLELPQWTKKIYPQPLNDLVLKDYVLQLGTKEMARIALGRLITKILEDSENHTKGKSNYKVHLYAGHEFTLAHILTFLKISYKNHAGFGACLAFELYEENGSWFLELYYKDDKHSNFQSVRFSNGEKRLYLHELREMVNELYADDVKALKRNVSSTLFEKQVVHLLLTFTALCGVYSNLH